MKRAKKTIDRCLVNNILACENFVLEMKIVEIFDLRKLFISECYIPFKILVVKYNNNNKKAKQMSL